MRLWRRSSARRAHDFDGGYGLAWSGRWNSGGRPVTYCATVPSLAALEKRVHVTDSALLPPQALVEYETPDDISVRMIALDDLPRDWARRETLTQRLGDAWLDACEEALLVIPSVIMAVARASDRNVVINHRHRDCANIRIAEVTTFSLDPRLFRP
jgi:RES domain-containing protein